MMRSTFFLSLCLLLLAACSTLRRDGGGGGTGEARAPADSTLADSAAVGAPPAGGTSQPALVQTRVLDNGLRVVVHENPVVPLVTIEIDVKNGAYTQSPEYEGLAHLYEHMFFKANQAIPNQERWLERTRELGITWNGTTSVERVNYFVTLHRENFREGLEFMRDAIRDPLFDQAELERERPVVLGEYDRAESDPSFFLSVAVDSLLWTPAYFSRKNVIGNREVIATTTREKMRTIQERYYVPNNSALILSGDVRAEEAFDLAEEVFGEWQRREDPFSSFPIPPVPHLAESKAVVVERPVNSVTLTLAWQGPSVTRNAASTYAADVFSAILDLPNSGFQKRIVDSGLAFGASLSYSTLAHAGPIRLTAQTTPERVVSLRRALEREIAAFEDPDYFTDEQLAAAKNVLRVADVYQREQPSAFAHTLGYWWAVASLQYYLNYVANLMNVDREDLAAYVRTYLQGRPHVAGVLIAPDDRSRIGLSREDLL
jgi:zinc protease